MRAELLYCRSVCSAELALLAPESNIRETLSPQHALQACLLWAAGPCAKSRTLICIANILQDLCCALSAAANRGGD